MDDWAAGYVSDVEYGSGFYVAQAPEMANLVSLIRGYRPRDLQRGYTFCELGCGSGSTLSVLAAGDARGRFLGVDFNPAHIAAGLELGTAAGLDNLMFSDASFGELLEAPDQIPDFDVISLHGVYSWVAPEVKRQVVEFLDKKLKPGGIVYISYNSLPGWLNCMPLQRLLREFGRRLPGTSIEQARGGLALLERLSDVKSAAVQDDNPFLNNIRKASQIHRGSYIAHEYMNSHWQPLYFREVAEDLSAARLKYVGSLNIFDNYPDMCFSEEQRQAIDSMPDPIMRETVADYCQVKLLRRDIFVRGPRRAEDSVAARMLSEQWMAMITDPDKVSLTVKPPRGEAQLNPDTYGPLLEALADGPKPIGLLCDISASKGGNRVAPVEVAGVLTACGWAVPIGPNLGTPDPQRAGRYNAAVARHVRDAMTFERLAFAVPSFRGGIPIDGFDALMMAEWLDGAHEPQDIADRVWALVEARDENIVKDGEALTDPEARNNHLLERADRFLNGVLRRLSLGGAL
ncbi:MAG: methyltransferase regulatory domain-containing protein [Rhodospirillaceae bacterium]|nr:methyltransferase regulatory domain-containing protein [Rhodospirillaceae bacterium]